MEELMSVVNTSIEFFDSTNVSLLSEITKKLTLVN